MVNLAEEQTKMVKSTFFAVKTTGGQERTVANFVYTRVTNRNMPVYSVIQLDTQKGYIYVEAKTAHAVDQAIHGFKHVKGRVPGTIQPQDIERLIVTKSVISELNVDDEVEVIAGPFKGMRARVQRIERSKEEVTIVLLDAPYQLPVTVDAKYLKIVKKAKEGGE